MSNEFPREPMPHSNGTNDATPKSEESDERRRVYDAFVETARTSGYKIEFAGVKYRERFGEWPPDAWKRQTEAQFDADPEWRAKQEDRQQRSPVNGLQNGVIRPPPPSDDRTLIVLDDDRLWESVDQAVGALRSDTNLFTRDGILVHVSAISRDEVEKSDIVDAATENNPERRELVEGTPQIRELPIALVYERLSRVASFRKLDMRSHSFVPRLPPKSIARAVHAVGRCEGKIRALIGVAETPFMRPDGTICQDAGYDSTTKYLYAPSIDFPRVPDSPTRSDAQAQYEIVLRLFKDFPFVADGHRSVPIAGAMSIKARPAIVGPVPAFLFDGNTRGVGKSLITDVIAITASGRAMPRKNYPNKEDELEKVLSAYALQGTPFVSLDNVNGLFGGGSFDMYVAAFDTVDLRLLGFTKIPRVTWRTVVFSTGNNYQLHADTSDRVLISRMETDLENPRTRTNFEIPDLLSYVRHYRAELVVGLLTILRAYIVAGRPNMGCPRWGTFESWSSLIPHAIVYAGGADPMVCRILDETAVNEDLQALRTILEGWEALLIAANTLLEQRAKITRGSPPPRKSSLTSGEVIEALYNPATLNVHNRDLIALRGAIEGLCCPGKKSGDVVPTPRALTRKLKSYEKRNVGGLHLRSGADSHTHLTAWWVEDVRTPQ